MSQFELVKERVRELRFEREDYYERHREMFRSEMAEIMNDAKQVLSGGVAMGYRSVEDGLNISDAAKAAGVKYQRLRAAVTKGAIPLKVIGQNAYICPSIAANIKAWRNRNPMAPKINWFAAVRG